MVRIKKGILSSLLSLAMILSLGSVAVLADEDGPRFPEKDVYGIEYMKEVLNTFSYFAMDGNFKATNHINGGFAASGNIQTGGADGIDRKGNPSIVYGGGAISMSGGIKGYIVYGLENQHDNHHLSGTLTNCVEKDLKESYVDFSTAQDQIKSASEELTERCQTKVAALDEEQLEAAGLELTWTEGGIPNIYIPLGSNIKFTSDFWSEFDRKGGTITIVDPKGTAAEGGQLNIDNVGTTLTIEGNDVQFYASRFKYSANGYDSGWPTVNYDPNLYVWMFESMPIIWNLPDAENVKITESFNFAGHIIAPKAKAAVSCSNLDGGIIAKEIDLSGLGEGHHWGYKDNEDPDEPNKPDDPKKTAKLIVIKKVEGVEELPSGYRVTFTLTPTGDGETQSEDVAEWNGHQGQVEFSNLDPEKIYFLTEKISGPGILDGLLYRINVIDSENAEVESDVSGNIKFPNPIEGIYIGSGSDAVKVDDSCIKIQVGEKEDAKITVANVYTSSNATPSDATPSNPTPDDPEVPDTGAVTAFWFTITGLFCLAAAVFLYRKEELI